MIGNDEYKVIVMDQYRGVQEGECLSTMAKDVGLRSWCDIYDDPKNAALRKSRNNPNVMNPGDTVYVPEVRLRRESGETENRHRFRLRRESPVLRLRLLDEHWQPLVNRSYTLSFGLDIREGELDADAILEELPPADARSARLEVVVNDAADVCVWNLQLVALRPTDEDDGVRQRLENLALEAGTTGDHGAPSLQEAVRAFQRVQGLQETGVVDTRFEQRLAEVHGV